MIDKMSQQNNEDENFVAGIKHALDKSLDDIDELNLQRLKNARTNALASAQSRPSRKWASSRWVNMSVAASLIALVLIPFTAHKYLQDVSLDQDFEIIAQDVPYSAEEMDDIEMLMSLESESESELNDA